jgi:diguanylate cyclase (GGDEF)-like protein
MPSSCPEAPGPEMRDRRRERLSSALFRLLAAHPRFDAAALVDSRVAPPRPVASTPALLALRRDGGGDWPTAPPVTCPAARLDPARLGLDAGFAATAPVPAPDGGLLGYLLVADRRDRRLTAAMARTLADVAALAAPLFPQPADRPAAAPSPEGAATLRGAVRPRAAAERLIELALRRQPAGPVGLMTLDVDRFRAFNQALGSAAGDALLATTGARLQAALGPGGFLLRLDGDRFVVVAPGDPEALAVLARRLLDAVSQPLALDGRMLVIQASIGVVAGPAAGVPPSDLLIRADAALRRAKAEGRNRFVLDEPAHAAAALDGSRLELDLAGALGSRQMHLVYQPYVDLADGRVAGFETLLRWRHPLRGELNPAAFIAAAEATGQILPLGDWVLRTALAAAARWPRRLSLAVNISPLQFHQPGFLARIDAALAESGLPPERLELEITETVLMRDNPETTAVLRALIARGVRIALDDFGTGYSALAYLARLPHHRIKLDKAFVHDLANPATADLIRAIIATARAQGVAVTAEGVERPEQLPLVRRAGFTHAQGYAVGLPVGAPDAYFAEPDRLPVH